MTAERSDRRAREVRADPAVGAEVALPAAQERGPMAANVREWFDLPPWLHHDKRRTPLILVNGLAEQSESWFANRAYLARHFDVEVPEILVYDGAVLHQRIDAGGAVT